MGHDITARRTSETGAQVAYLRRGAFNDINGTLYEALGAQDCNCGVSGCGEDRTFTLAQLTAALAKVPAGEDYEPERVFLTRCIAAGEDLTIEFS